MSTYHGYGVYNSYQQGQRYAQQEPVHTTFARLNTSLWLTAVQWGGPQAYAFQYPKCTGHRKALLIGINYFGQLGQLRGCINDVRNMMAFLHEQYGYSGDDIVMLADDFQYPLSQPTKQNILSGMHWLVKSAQPGDSLFFHFSAHGGGLDEVIYSTDFLRNGHITENIFPVDFRENGHIPGDEIHRIMVKSLPPGARLTAIFDSLQNNAQKVGSYVLSKRVAVSS